MSKKMMVAMEEESPLLQIVGPLFLISALALAGQTIAIFNLDLAAIAVIGLVLSAKWKIRGCAYALVLLALSAAIKHLWIRDHHVFQAALEGSVGFSLLIFSLVCEQELSFFGSLKQQIDNRSQTIRYLEEDLIKQKETSNGELASYTEKLMGMQQQLEEVQGDLSALQILNEVLRNASANAIEEKKALSTQVLQAQHHTGQLFEEIDSLQTELKRLSHESALAKQNSELFQELNQIRFKEAQTHQINETLVRLHAQQKQRLKELEAEREGLDRELQEKHAAVERSEVLQIELEASQAKESAMNSSIQGLQSLHREERTALEAQLAALKEQLGRAQAESLEHLQTLSTRSDQSAHVGTLYRQLKAQFEEKNKVLHQVRSQLFHADTELQTLKMRAEQMREPDPVPEEMQKELEVIELENALLAEENGQLQELVTQLMKPAAPKSPKAVKKKVNTPPLIEQTLF